MLSEYIVYILYHASNGLSRAFLKKYIFSEKSVSFLTSFLCNMTKKQIIRAKC